MALEVLEALDTAAPNITTSKPLSLPEWGFALMHKTYSVSQQWLNSWVAFITMTLPQESPESSL